MKNIYALLIALCIAFTVEAQIAIEPNPVIVSDFDVTAFEAVGYATVTNQSQSNKMFTWTRNVIEMTEGWSSAVCDLNQCYLSFVSTQEFALGAGQAGNLDVHLYPDSIEGSAIIEVILTDNSDPSNTATALYLFNETLSAPERLNNALKIYPNPAQDFLMIEGADAVERIEFYDIQGRIVQEFQIFGAGMISIGDLNRGNYIVRMFDANGIQISSNLLQIK
jgi:hypothetical protein